jgi:periplasmic copper chaperone A
MMRWLGCAALCTLAAAAQTSAAPAVSGAWARATPPGVDTGAVYLTIVNGAARDALVAARSGAARDVELHDSTQSNDVISMRKLERRELAPGEKLELAPLGAHLMLIGLAAPLVPGRDIAVTLVFEHAGNIEVTVPVVDARTMPPTTHHEHGHH